MTNKILLVDDDENLLATLADYFENAGFLIEKARNGKEALQANRDGSPELIVMDMMMPIMDGFEALQEIRKASEVPVIMLTAKDEDLEKIKALEMGVDDYLTKPFNPRELLARVRAILRRSLSSESAPPRVLRHRGFEINLDNHEAFLGANALELTPSEFDLLTMFIERPGRLFTRMDILERLQGEAFAGYERTVDVHIKNLRSKIEGDPKNSKHIETVYGLGYRMAKDES